MHWNLRVTGARRPPDVRRDERGLPARDPPAARVDRRAARARRRPAAGRAAAARRRAGGEGRRARGPARRRGRRGRGRRRRQPSCGSSTAGPRAARSCTASGSSSSSEPLTAGSVRGGRRSRRGRGGRRTAARAAVESTGATRLRRVRRPAPARRPPPPRRLDRRRRHEADARAPRAAACATAAPTSPRTASTTSPRAGPSRCCCSTTSPRPRSDSTRSPSSSRAQPKSAATAGVALVGGETAELPGIYRDGRARLRRHLRRRGRRRDDLVDGSASSAGDVVIGFASAGVHANGFTLVRRRARGRGLRRPRPARPDPALPRRRAALRGRAKAFAHVTGGGIAGNLARVAPGRARAPSIDWERLGAPARVRTGSPATSTRTSCGACSTSGSAGARSSPRPARRARDRADRMIGVLVSGNGTNLQALIDHGLPIAAVASNRRTPTHCSARATPASRPRRSASTATPTAPSATW